MPALDVRAVLPLGSWRDAAHYAGLASCGRRGLAWELLRRDPAYAPAAVAERASARFAGLSDELASERAVVPTGAPDSERDGALLPPASAAFAARWGLHFR